MTIENGKAVAPPTVSVGLPVYNGEAYLDAALESLTTQDFQDFEIVVCDNASTDGTAAIVQPLANAGKIRILAVTSRERASFAPDIPTVHELGWGGLAVETTAGLYGPKDMPLPLREKIARDVVEVISDPAIAGKLLATGQVVRPGGPAELAATIKEQSDLTARIAKVLELKPKN